MVSLSKAVWDVEDTLNREEEGILNKVEVGVDMVAEVEGLPSKAGVGKDIKDRGHPLRGLCKEDLHHISSRDEVANPLPWLGVMEEAGGEEELGG